MKTWQQRLEQRLQELGMRPTQLADEIGKTRSLVSRYLKGERTPPIKMMEQIARAVKCDPAWLQFGTEASATSSSKNKNIKEASSNTATTQGVPLINWDAVKTFVTRRNTLFKTQEFAPFLSNQKDPARLFALRVKGDAMVATTGRERSFHEGDVLIADPDKSPSNGCYVIAVLPGTKEANFKQYVVDGGIKYLKPVNPQYPTTELNNKTQICGIVVACINNLLPHFKG
jgi:SOS-response transcriptional repressor LexA